MPSGLIEYGKKGNSREIKEILAHIFDRNNELNANGQSGTPICIWGTHGLGKTQLVKDFAKERNWKFSYIAPAQFEEMGDLHGMPNVIDPDPTVAGDEFTVYSPPEWVPKEEGPGILLLDDINRADDRILRGCMQLLQNFELSSWKLPPKWQIVVTANPEGGDYSVTPMDGAMITRLLHVTLKFDAKIWAEWAEKASVDPRGIAFVLTYPELINDERTTPNDLSELLDPSEILNAENFENIKKKIVDLSKDSSGVKRLDRLSTICTRLYLKLISEDYSAENGHKENLIQFLQMEEIPNDLLMSLYLDLSKSGNNQIKEMIRDKTLATKLLISI